MPTLYNAPSVDPADVKPADIAAILTEHGIDAGEPVPADFFQVGTVYRQDGNGFFQCLATGCRDSVSVALGLLSITLSGQRTWEFGYLIERDWRRGWTTTTGVTSTATIHDKEN